METSKLPDSEYEIMDYIWGQIPPVTSAMVMENVGRQKNWKAQTLLTLLSRLCDRGFLSSEKKLGREKAFYPLISRQQYLRNETRAFAHQFHRGSAVSLLAAFADEALSENEIDELEQLIKQMKERSR